VYGWEQKKTKASWGETIDYGSIAENAVREMDDSHVQHFFMVCALVSDLYCPGYGPRQPLGKDSNLARAAARYKVDLTKVSAAVRAELSKPTKKPAHKTKRKAAATAKTKAK